MKIVVIGASGLIGSKLVAALHAQGVEVVPAAPDTGVNTLTGAGLADALDGASVVVDVSNAPLLEDTVVLEFFETSTRNLLEAEATAGVCHHVVLSIVGTDRLPDSSYYAAKLSLEKLVAGSSIPYSIVHATQFFEFIEHIAQAGSDGDTVRVAPVRVRPIAADDVVGTLARVSMGEALNSVLEIAGPEQFRLDALIGRVLDERGDSRRVVADSQAPYFGGHLNEDTLVPADKAELGAIHLEDWLELGARR